MADEPTVAEGISAAGDAMMGCGCIICLIPIIVILLAAVAAVIGTAGL